jgi:hypothetical protein
VVAEKEYCCPGLFAAGAWDEDARAVVEEVGGEVWKIASADYDSVGIAEGQCPLLSTPFSSIEDCLCTDCSRALFLFPNQSLPVASRKMPRCSTLNWMRRI